MSTNMDDFRTILTSAYRIDRIDDLSLLSGLQWNSTLRVESNSRTLYLKSYRPRYQSSCISFSHALTGTLRDRGYEPAPRYVPTEDGRTFLEWNGALYDLSEEISGEKHPMRHFDKNLLRETARELARFHNLSRLFGRHSPPAWTHSFHMDDCCPEMLSRDTLQWSLLGPREAWARDVLRRAMHALGAHARRLDAKTMRGEVGLPVHGDFTLDNLTFRGGRVAGELDWESTYPDELPLYDILKSAASFFSDRSYDEDVARLFFEAYGEEARLSQPEPSLVMALWLFSRLKWTVKMLALMNEADVPRLLRSVETLQAELENPAHKRV